MQAAQKDAGVPLADSAAVLNFTEQTYLKRAITQLSGCVAFTGPAAAGVVAADGHIDLETTAAAAAGLPPTTTTPLANVTQGSTNMCSAFAFAQAYTIKYALQHTAAPPQLSPTFAYFFQRVEECKTTGTCPCPSCKVGSSTCTSCAPPCVDCGSYVQSALTVYMGGVCASTAWPVTQPMNEPPTASARDAAPVHTVVTYRCITLDSVLAALRAGAPVVVLLSLTPAAITWLKALVNYAPPSRSTLETDSGVVFPGAGRSSGAAEPLGHVVLITGYSPRTKRFIVRNSFGFAWGSNGRFTIQDTDMTATNIAQAVAILDVD